jgi:hypothetical protein
VINVFVTDSWVVIFKPSCCKLPRMFHILSHQDSCSDGNTETSVIATNAHTKRHVSALDYIQILCHEVPAMGLDPLLYVRGPSSPLNSVIISLIPRSAMYFQVLSPLTSVFQYARRTTLSPASFHVCTSHKRSVQNASRGLASRPIELLYLLCCLPTDYGPVG